MRPITALIPGLRHLWVLAACLVVAVSASAADCGCDEGTVIPVVFRQHAFFAGKIRNTVSVDGQRQAEMTYRAGRVIPDPGRPGYYVATEMGCGEWEATVRVLVKPGQLITVTTDYNSDDRDADYTVAGDPPADWPHNPTLVLNWPAEACVKLFLAFDGGRTLVPFEHGGSYGEPGGKGAMHFVVKYGEEDHSAAGSSSGPEAGRVRRAAPTFVVPDIESRCSGTTATTNSGTGDAAASSSAMDAEPTNGRRGGAGLVRGAKPAGGRLRAERDSYRLLPLRDHPGKPARNRSTRRIEELVAPAEDATTAFAPMERRRRDLPSRGPKTEKVPAATAAPSSTTAGDEPRSLAATAVAGELVQSSIGALKMRLALGGGAGDLIYEVSAISAEAYWPSTLRLVGSGVPAGLIRRDANGALQQILASSGAIDIVTVSATAFEIRYYRTDQVEPEGDGFRVTDANPVCVWSIDNPDAAATNRVRFRQQRGPEQSVHVATWQPANADHDGRMVLSYFGDAEVEERTYYVGSLPAGYRAERIQRRRGTEGEIDSDVYEVYAEFHNWGGPGEVYEALVYRAEGVGSPEPRVTEWTYADDGFLRGRFLTSVIHPDGYWERYIYASDGELRQTFSPWRDSPSHPSLVNASYTNCRRRLVTYEAGTLPESEEWRVVEDYAPNPGNLASPFLIGQSQTLQRWNLPGGRYQEDQWTRLDAYEHTYTARLFERKNGALLWDVRATGAATRTMREWGYWVPAQGEFSYTSGGGNPIAQRVVHHEGTVQQPFGLANQTLVTERVEDAEGRPFVETVFVSDGKRYIPGTRSDWLTRHTYTYNERGQLTVVTRNGAVIRETWYDGDGRIREETDESGVREEFRYDEFGRIRQRIRHPGTDPVETHAFAYDAASNVLTESVTAGAGEATASRTTTNGYDTAGRLVSQATPDGLTWGFAEAFLFNAAGHVLRRETRETRPDRSVVITEHHQDRRLFRRYGDVPPEYVAYTHASTTGGPGTISTSWGYPVSVTFRDLAGTQLRLTRWTDWAGSSLREIRPGFPGQGSYVNDFYYDTDKGGQLGISYHAINTSSGYVIVGQAPRIFEYDELGRLVREGLDYNGNWILDRSGLDPVTLTSYRLEQSVAPAAWHRVTQRTQLQTDNSLAETVLSETREQLNGLPAGVEAVIEVLEQGRRATTTVTFDRTSATRTTSVRDHAATASAAPHARVEVAGRLRSEQAPSASAATRYTYYPLGELESVTDPILGATRYAYAPGGALVAVTDALERTTSTTYHPDGGAGAGKPATTTDAAGVVTHYAYDGRSRLWRQWGGNNYPRQFDYDDDDRLTSLRTFRTVDAPEAGGVDWASGAWPENAPAGDLTQWLFHFSGLLERKRYADHSAIVYNYDNIGRLRTRTNARAQVATYSYDSSRSGRLTGIAYSGGSNTPNVSMLYDRALRPRSVTDGSGSRTLTYAASGAPGTEAYASGLLAGYSSTRTYNEHGQPFQLQLPGVYTAEWSYDDLARPDRIDGLSGSLLGVAAGYGYKPGTSWLHRTTWFDATEVRLQQVRDYDEVGRLTEVANQRAEGAPWRRFRYAQFDELDRRTRVEVDETGGWDYRYNPRGELVEAQREDAASVVLPGHDFRYAFDTIGNRRLARVDGAESTYRTNGLNQYVDRSVPEQIAVIGTAAQDATVTVDYVPSWRAGPWFGAAVPVDNAASAVAKTVTVVAVRNEAGPDGEDAVATVERAAFVPRSPEVYSHDADGNLLGDGRWTYGWDAENRLVSCETAAAAVAAGVARVRLEFVYDSGSRRMAKRVYGWNGALNEWGLSGDTRYLYDGWNLVAEFSASGTALSLVRSHLWGLDVSGTAQGAGGVGGLLATVTSEGAYLPWFDGNGNVMGYSHHATGQSAASFDYGPFGEPIISTGDAAAALPYRFSTKYEDGETGLLYYGYRYYTPATGRWLSRDPLGEAESLNRYRGMQNNAANDFDFNGAYSEGGHFYTTYAVAKSRGYSEKDAYRLAYFSQLPDEYIEFSAWAGDLSLMEASLDHIRRRWLSDGWLYKVQVLLHSLTGKPIQDRRECLKKLLAQSDLTIDEKGLLIHALGDAYAHSFYNKNVEMGFRYPVGHADAPLNGMAPDLPSLRPALYNDYLNDLFESLPAGPLPQNRAQLSSLIHVNALVGNPFVAERALIDHIIKKYAYGRAYRPELGFRGNNPPTGEDDLGIYSTKGLADLMEKVACYCH